MITIGKKSKYEVHLLNEMGNAIECHYLKAERELTNFLYSIDDNQLFKAYISNGLYCWHKRLG
jgi:hypothetical protein